AIVLADFVAHGEPRIKAGAEVEIKGVGERLSGTYVVTSSTHTLAPSHGYETTFVVRGRGRGSILELSSHDDGQDGRRLGPVLGVVTNVKDPNNLGRVKVKFPWLSDDEESAWARLISPMAGPQRGFEFVPEVDDEVVVIV